MARIEIRRLFLRLCLCLCPAALTLLASSGAMAADDAQQRARVLYQKGNAAFKKGDDVMAREYYRESLQLQESFDTTCNLGRTLARSEIYEEAYERLRMCVYLYPEDRELASARENFIALREDVRKELSFDQAHPIDERVDAEIGRRQEAERAPESGLEQSDALPPAVVQESPTSSAKLPVTLTLGGLGAVSLGVGLGALVHSGAKKRSADDIRASIVAAGGNCESPGDPQCEELRDTLKASDSAQSIGVIGVVAGGSLLAGAALAYFLWPAPQTGSANLTAPLVSFDPLSRDVFLGVQGSF